MQTINIHFPRANVVTAGHDVLYRLVANTIAAAPDHLAELVQLMDAIKAAGVDVVDLWDCLCEALILEELK